LYTISSGELGVETASVEANLSTALQLATKWNAIVLIDEADVFLEQRRAKDLQRNALVSSESSNYLYRLPLEISSYSYHSLPPDTGVL
jgi:hypothetical protein